MTSEGARCSGCGEFHNIEIPDGANDWSILVQTVVRDEVNRRVEVGEEVNSLAVVAGVGLALGAVIRNIQQNCEAPEGLLANIGIGSAEFAIEDAAEQMKHRTH